MIKNIILILLLLISIPVWAEEEKKLSDFQKKYIERLDKCEEKTKKELNRDGLITTEDMVNASNDETICFRDIAYEIIEKYYKKDRQEEIKKDFTEYIQATSGFANDISGLHNVCPCGTMMVVFAHSQKNKYVRIMVEELISMVDMFNNWY
ncbi:MAG: hypothetical protein ACI4N3_04490 [Alphaproteobacteria bacterium]